MNKEVFLAILAGGVFGLLIAFGVWRANAYLNSGKNGEIQKQNSQSSTTSALKITVSQPQDAQVITSSPVTISGLARPQSYVIAAGVDSDEMQMATDDGSFKVPVDLTGGANQIKVSSLNSNEESSDTDLLLVFSTEFQKDKTASSSGNITATDDAVRAKVQAELDKVTQTGTSFLGTITDLPDDTIQIKNLKGEIQQISVNPDTTNFIKTTGNAAKVIKKTDLAIGDFIIAMGTKNGSVLNASRILVADPVTASKRKILIGKVADITKTSFNLKTKDGKTFATTFTTDTNVFNVKDGKKTAVKFSAITNDSLVITVGEVTDNKLTARTVWIIASK